MGCPKRAVVVFLSFLGFLVLFGFRTVFTMVMVYVIKDNDNDGVTLFQECTINGTDYDLQLDWSVSTSQYFNTAYFVGYVITQLPGGFLAVRFSATKIFGGSIFISGSCFVILAFTMKYSRIIVFVIRFIQGFVEGVCQPAMSSIVSAWAPKSERARIVGLSYSGLYLSTSLASVVTGAATCYVSWHAGLFIYGTLGIILSLVWFAVVYDSPGKNPHLSEKEQTIFEREGSKIKIASADVIGFLTSFPPVLMAVFIIFGGVLMDELIKKEKISTTVGRKLSICIGFGSEAAIIIVLGFVQSYTVASILLVIGEGFAGFGIAGYKVNPVDLAPQYASVLAGLVTSGVFGAIVSTAIAGALRQKNAESWQKILVITGSVHLFAVIIYAIFGSGKQQEWAHPAYEKLVTPKSERKQRTYESTNEPFPDTSSQNGRVGHLLYGREIKNGCLAADISAF
uniref:Vesicular glutamate transporter 3 n=1 Tax=Magallana gigas TaxID=29159 RepID=K1Q749_MAGGI